MTLDCQKHAGKHSAYQLSISDNVPEQLIFEDELSFLVRLVIFESFVVLPSHASSTVPARDITNEMSPRRHSSFFLT